jgi:hypothetical protein
MGLAATLEVCWALGLTQAKPVVSVGDSDSAVEKELEWINDQYTLNPHCCVLLRCWCSVALALSETEPGP